MRRPGFTLIEVLITVAVITMLVVIAVAVMRNGEMNARDDTRTTNVAEIAQQLETYYTSGTGNGAGATVGHYPNCADMGSATSIESTLRDLDQKTLWAPGVPSSSPISLVCATVATTPTIPAQANTTTYLYQPLTSTNALCDASTPDTSCRKFNLYYVLEGSSTTLQTVTSKNQ